MKKSCNVVRLSPLLHIFVHIYYITLNAGVESPGRALKSNDRIMSTALCGRNTNGNGELNVKPASTMYRCFTLVGCNS